LFPGPKDLGRILRSKADDGVAQDDGVGQVMAAIRFDVNDAALRDEFLRHLMLEALTPLAADRPAAWGHMTAQQMVEHLAWVFAVSTGRDRLECPVPEPDRERMKPFLRSNRPTPREFMNPALVGGLPPLLQPGLAEAKAVLRAEVDRFLEHSLRDPDALHVHPVFGPIDAEGWSRTHFKHGFHHLLQFGLVEGL
jgi:DinB family protein